MLNNLINISSLLSNLERYILSIVKNDNEQAYIPKEMIYDDFTKNGRQNK